MKFIQSHKVMLNMSLMDILIIDYITLKDNIISVKLIGIMFWDNVIVGNNMKKRRKRKPFYGSTILSKQ